MGGLLTSILNSAGAMNVFERQLAVVQNNVVNASTPGYASQSLTIVALPFQADGGLPGGISAGPIQSSRSEYAESSVRQQNGALGQAQQKATDLSQVESLFDVSGKTGISSDLSKFFQSFSQLSVNPNDQIARQTVIDSAGRLAGSINQTAIGLANASGDADKQVEDSITAVNNLAGVIRDLNISHQQDTQNGDDPSLDAKLHSTLETLSQYGNVTLFQRSDGTATVYFGQTQLVDGGQVNAIHSDTSTPLTKIVASDGTNLTSQIQTGKLAGLLQEKNQLLPAYQTDLNTLARSLSDQVNQQLSNGLDANGASPTVDLFSYNSTIGEAASLSVTDITPDQIAAASPSAPGGNANALTIAGMLDSKSINGFSFTQFYGNIAGHVGSDLSQAQNDQQTRASTLTQAKNLRDQASGVSIDEEAAHLIQIQRAYQASGKMLTVLDELTTTVIGLIT
jgi:flagellar hook-associated protein 1